VSTDDNDEKVDGPGIAAQILNRMNTRNKDRIVERIKTAEPALAAKIQEKLYTFEEIATLTPQGVQLLIKEIDHRDLVLSLKAASTAVKGTLLQNMSERKQQVVQDDLAALPPTRLSEVEEAQRRIMNRLDNLRMAGMIKTQSKQDVWV
jgi:flagellar motor switch protein FliG